MLTTLSLLASLAFAQNVPVETPPAPPGELVVDARVPAEILVDGLPIGQLYVPSELRASIASGKRKVSVVRGGRPEDLTVEVPPDDAVLLLVGKTGTTIGVPDDAPLATGPTGLEIRVAGNSVMQLRIDRSRIELAPGQVVSLELPPGLHPVSVRNRDGTVVWANGSLDLKGAAVMQLAEGRMPEITGEAAFLGHGG